ncbi:MAG: hypothetical protein JSR79_07565 [Proteobacteria bacterium]|nr:hypothetical protein [Pseudomonadota bacterium]
MPNTSSTAADDTIAADPTRRAGRMESALNSARDAAADALEETREAARRAGQAIQANPVAIVVGGVAVGLAAGALLPKTKRETELLGPVGKRLTGAAADAASAAKDAAKVELATIPLSKDAAREQVGKVLDQVARAISEAGEAALAGKRQPIVDNEPRSAAEPATRKPRRKAD